MAGKTCILIGAPVDSGKKRKGCLMGPDAYRTAGIAETIRTLGHEVRDRGNIAPAPLREATCPAGCVSVSIFCRGAFSVKTPASDPSSA